jgi:hypothetical protein
MENNFAIHGFVMLSPCEKWKGETHLFEHGTLNKSLRAVITWRLPRRLLPNCLKRIQKFCSRCPFFRWGRRPRFPMASPLYRIRGHRPRLQHFLTRSCVASASFAENARFFFSAVKTIQLAALDVPDNQPPTSVRCLPSSVFRPLSAVFRPPSSDLRPLSAVNHAAQIDPVMRKESVDCAVGMRCSPVSGEEIQYDNHDATD